MSIPLTALHLEIAVNPNWGWGAVGSKQLERGESRNATNQRKIIITQEMFDEIGEHIAPTERTLQSGDDKRNNEESKSYRQTTLTMTPTFSLSR